eukprot:GHVN01015815.1.p1 GENE.GHVN01015815.1~~GHVN01015815.1.p1  ORF type:complete len:308 (-),score=44.11 GHVN01015815.1:1581-2504(-)
MSVNDGDDAQSPQSTAAQIEAENEVCEATELEATRTRRASVAAELVKERRKTAAEILSGADGKSFAQMIADGANGAPIDKSRMGDSNSSVASDSLHAPSLRDMRVYLNLVRDRFKAGHDVIKIASSGAPYKRKIYVNAKPEYFEISSGGLFDTARHFLDIDSVEVGEGSPDFAKMRAKGKTGSQSITTAHCCVVHCQDRAVSLVFRKTPTRNEFVYLLRVCRQVTAERYLERYPVLEKQITSRLSRVSPEAGVVDSFEKSKDHVARGVSRKAGVTNSFEKPNDHLARGNDSKNFEFRPRRVSSSNRS